MSEIIKNITSTYNDMSKSKKYNQAYLDGYRQCVVDVQESEPQLNPDQKIVLWWLKENSTDYSDVMGVILLARNLPPYSKVFKILMALPTKQQAQVVQAFTDWWLSENE